MTNKELEVKTTELEKNYSEMMQGFRKLSANINNNLKFIQEVKREVEGLKAEILNLKSSKGESQYENSTQR